jgi:hypothetical protein
VIYEFGYRKDARKSRNATLARARARNRNEELRAAVGALLRTGNSVGYAPAVINLGEIFTDP